MYFLASSLLVTSAPLCACSALLRSPLTHLTASTPTWTKPGLKLAKHAKHGSGPGLWSVRVSVTRVPVNTDWSRM